VVCAVGVVIPAIEAVIVGATRTGRLTRVFAVAVTGVTILIFAENCASLVVAEVRNAPNSGVLETTLLLEIPQVIVAVTVEKVTMLPTAVA